MSPRSLIWFPAALCLFSLHAAADEAAIRASFAQKLPEMKIVEISKLAHGDLYEVIYDGTNILYTDGSGSIALVGQLHDVATKENLTEKRLADLRRVDFAKLPLDQAIVKVKGDGRRRMAVFTDPDCPYCKQLEQELAQVTDVTLYIFLYPLKQIHPDAERKAKAVWCSPDRAGSWDAWMLQGTAPSAKTDCDTPVEAIAELGRQLGIEGTPGIVFGNGRFVPGLIPGAQIESILAEQTAKGS
jgi:thiol:disulfide interchange protein DsbC